MSVLDRENVTVGVLSQTQAEEREKIRRRWPRNYEKQQRFDANAASGVISPIIRVCWSYVCNFTCTHCCAKERIDEEMGRGPHACGSEPRRRMNYDDLARFAQEADEYGLYRMVLTGGEPSTWPDLFKVIKILDPNRHLIIMDSNAWLLSQRKDMIRDLAEAGMYKLQISLDSFNEHDHDEFREKKGSYKRVMEVLPRIRAAGIKLMISTCLVRGRAFTQEFEDLCRFCTDQGALLYVTYVKPVGDARVHLEKQVVTKDDTDQVRRLEEKYNVTTHMTPAFMRGDGTLGHYDGCITVKGINTLEPTGDLVPCPYMDWAIGNILDDPLATVLERGMMIRDLGPQRKDCLIGEDLDFMRRHNTVVNARKASGNHHLPVPYGEGFTDADLIDPSFAKIDANLVQIQ